MPIVAMTANAMEADRQRCSPWGMNDHVAKPVEPDDLWKVLLKWVKMRRGVDAGAPTGSPVPAADDLPVGIAGLDAEGGLRRMLGKKPFYLSMLRKFVEGQGATVAQIRAALESGDLDGAGRLAHTTKGWPARSARSRWRRSRPTSSARSRAMGRARRSRPRSMRSRCPSPPWCEGARARVARGR